jgi:hypothetical protein
MTDDELIPTLDGASTLVELAEAASLDTLDTAALLCTLDDAGGVGGLPAPPPPPQALNNETAANTETIFINEAAVINGIREHIYVFMVISYMKLIFLYNFIVVFDRPDTTKVHSPNN